MIGASKEKSINDPKKRSTSVKAEIPTTFHDTSVQRRSGLDQDCCRSLADVTSVDFFRTTPIERFRSQLILSLKLSLRSREEENDSDLGGCFPIRYHNESFAKSLDSVAWKTLCEDHDALSGPLKTKVVDNHQTALFEILSLLKNPMVIPRCCVNQLTKALLSAILSSPRLSLLVASSFSSSSSGSYFARWTPSQNLLLQTLDELCTSSSFCGASSIYEFVEKYTFSTPNQANRLVSTIYFLANKYRKTDTVTVALVSAGLMLLQRIDDWDIQQLLEEDNIRGTSPTTTRRDSSTPARAGDGSLCYRCKGLIGPNNTSLPPMNRLKATHNLSDLHEEAITTTKTSAGALHSFYGSHLTNHFRNRTFYDDNSDMVSLKKILSAKQTDALVPECTCSRTVSLSQYNSTVRSAKYSKLPSDWSTVRSRSYKKFLSFLHQQHQEQETQQLNAIKNAIATIHEMPRPFQLDEVTILQKAIHRPQSPAWRVNLAILAYSFPYHYQTIARLCWEGYQQNQYPTNDIFLRVYSEWVCECSFFDQREQAWEAFQPLRRHVMSLMEAAPATENELQQTEEEFDAVSRKNNEYDSTDNSTIEHNSALLACLSFFLMKRAHLFEPQDNAKKGEIHNTNKIEKDFQSFTSFLSVHCGDSPVPWLQLFSNVDDKRDLVLTTLQRLGILGFSMVEPEFEAAAPATSSTAQTKSNNREIQLHATKSWPFHPLFTMRYAMGRINRSVFALEGGKDLTSLLLSRPFGETKLKKKRKKKKEKRPVPILNYLHDDDIYCLIFSFCSFKRLTKIQQVCKQWKALVDSRCNSLWQNAYVSRFSLYKGQLPNKTTWKDIFYSKFISEQTIRFQRSAKGYKYRTCSYLGCLHVLKNSNQECQHNKYHQRLLEREMARQKKKEQNEMEKTSKAAATCSGKRKRTKKANTIASSRNKICKK